MNHGSPPACRNCGQALAGPYCAACGQRDLDLERPFVSLAGETFGTWFSWDGKFPRDLIHLLFRPGFLTREFIDGRRASHVPPVRFFLVMTVVFFLCSALTVDDGGPITLSPLPPETLAALKADPAHPIGFRVLGLTVEPSRENRRWLIERYERLTGDTGVRYVQWINRLFIAMVPIYGLLALAILRGRPRGYITHLVFALHLHTFFITFTVVTDGWLLLLPTWPVSAAAIPALTAGWTIIYLIVATRRFTQHHWGQSLWRAVALNLAYVLTLVIAIVLVSLWFLSSL